MTRTLVCLVLLPLLVASYSSGGSYGSGTKKYTEETPSSVVHVGGNAAEGADVQQWDAGTARVVAQDLDAYDTFAAAVQYTAQMFVNSVEGTFRAITRAIQFVDETFAITRRLLRTWSLLSGWFGAIARAVLSALSSMKHAVQHMFSTLGGLFSSFFKAVSQAVVDVLSTGYRWLNDNVFRVIRDVGLQVYLQVKGTWEAIGHCLLRTWSVLSGGFGALARAVLSTLSAVKHAVQHMFSTLGELFTSCFEAVSGAVVDVLSTVDRWLEDNVFLVIRDVMRQVYRWAKDAWEGCVAAMMPLIHAIRSALESALILARPLVDKLMWYAVHAFEIVETAAATVRDWICMRLRSLLDLVADAASFVFDVITMRVWHPFWHWLLRVAARAPCVAGTVADVIRAPLEDVAAKSGAAVSRVLLRGGAELHMLRDGHINGDRGTDEPLYVPATRIAMPNGPNRQGETLADWVKYNSWIAEEPANQSSQSPWADNSRVNAWTRVRVQTAFVPAASLQHDSPLQLELQTLSQTVVAGDPRRQFLLSGPQGSFGYIERSVTTHLTPFHRATSMREWLRLAAKQEPHSSSEPSGALPHVLVIEVPLASQVPSVPLYTWLVPVLLGLWVEAARLNPGASFIVKLLLTAFMWQVASLHLSSTVLGIWILLAVTRRGYTFTKWTSFLVLIVTGFLYDQRGGSERGWPGLFTAGALIVVFLAVERQVSKRRHRFQWKLQERMRAVAPAGVSFACVAALVVIVFSSWNATAAAHPSTVAVEGGRSASHGAVKPDADDAFMAETLVTNHFHCRLDPQRPITTTWTLFEPIDGDAPSADDIGRAAEKMRAVKATLRAASPPLPSGGGTTAGGNAACATLTDRQVDTLFTSTVCIFCACWALLRRSR
jgi:Flp pilus assembly pilin Flp